MKSKDSKLLNLIANKDEKAFDLFYHKYIKLIYKFVYSELGDQEQTDDLIQDFWVRVWEDPSFLKCKESGSVRSYMLQHLKFRILDLYRRTLSQLINETDPDEIENEIFEYNNIISQLSEQELLAIIQEALEDETMLVRNAFIMRINNWSVKEIAKTLSINPKTIYNNYASSLAIVRKHIEDNYPEFVKLKESR
ncbi:MAG: sigma-70 family RNA polymerase sigma factor [Anaerolineaceae bacterium]|nr:MAG: sigma-70 family RNA polymerase sigma factor [Anaerolineaceae bacterium]